MVHLSSIVRDLIVSIPISILKFRYLVRPTWCLLKDAEAGAPLATLFAQVVLFVASLCLQKTRLCSEYDHSGIKTAILYHICSVLLYYTNRWSRLRFIRRRCGVKVNSIANLIYLILGILLERFYEKSLASLCFALTMTILFLILVVIIQPRNDLGFFGVLIGVTGSVAYSLFQLKLGTWIVVAICFVLCAFKYWLDKNWLELELMELELVELKLHDYDYDYESPLERDCESSRWDTLLSENCSCLSNPFPAPVIQSIDALIVASFYLVWASAFLINCLNSESCASCSAMEELKCVAIYALWLSFAYIHWVYYSLFQVEFWVLLPKTKQYMRAILKMEYALNNMKRLEEARHRRRPHAEHVVKSYLMWKYTGNKDEYVMKTDWVWIDSGNENNLIERLCNLEKMKKLKLPKWVRKKIENKIFKTQEDIDAFYERNLEEIADGCRNLKVKLCGLEMFTIYNYRS